MEIVAKTKEGFLIQATEDEVKAILTSVLGVCVKTVEIGQKVSAIDYATTVTKIKELYSSYKFRNLFDSLEAFNGVAEELRDAVMNARDLDM